MDANGKFNYKTKLSPVTFLICLSFAFVAWAIINFSEEYTVTMSYRVVCEDLPPNKQSVTLSDSVLLMNFRAKGVHFLHPKYKNRNRVINISISKLTKNGMKRNVYTFNKKTLGDYIKTMPSFEKDFIEIESPELFTIYLK